MIQLFVGLGNPGANHEDTRHNAGFWWIDEWAQQLGVTLLPDKHFHGWAARTQLGPHTIWLLKPATFMNLSGQAVASLARFYKIAPERILVVHDELDLPPGVAKLKCGGGHAGHNGLRDIHAQLGTDAYWRLRIGIGHPGVKSEVIHWVLKKPAPDQKKLIHTCITHTLQAVASMASGDMVQATHLVHTRQPPRPKPPKPAAVVSQKGELNDPSPPPAPTDRSSAS